MENRFKLLTTLTVAVFLFTSSSSMAQVNIGSDVKSSNGALLDLREFAPSMPGGATSTKGMNLPRVALKANNMQQFTGTQKPVGYEGFVVFNVTTNKAHDLCAGVNVWNGDKFVSLTGRVDIEEYVKMEYANGDSYEAVWIGDHCGHEGQYWTRTNLYRYTNKDGEAFAGLGNNFDDDDQPRLHSGTAVSISNMPATAIPTTGFPTFGISYGIGDTKAEAETRNKLLDATEFAKEFGLHYNFSQANEVCAHGWHLPSIAEWNKLIKAVDLVLGQPDNNIAAEYLRRDHKFYCGWTLTPLLAYEWGQFDTKTRPKSGFDALPSGYVHSVTKATQFGISAVYRSSDSGQGKQLLQIYNQLGPVGSVMDDADFYSVRCVRD